MIRQISRQALIGGVMALVCLATASATAAPRPFRMSLQGNAAPAPTADPCVLTNTESGTGQALHLGAITWVSNEVVDLCADGGPRVTAEFRLTAANGDMVLGRLRTVARFDFVTNQVTFAGLWEVAGGTGRFQNAKGQGQLSGWGSLLTPFDVTAEFSGEIEY